MSMMVPQSLLSKNARKRTFDVIAALVIALLLLPTLLGIILLQCISLRSTSIWFSQYRVGRGGRMFKCFKFRTMVFDADAKLAQHLEINPAAREEWARTQKLRDDPRVTFVGKYLRSLSLDELPQLWNILRGDMSLVGPRPITLVELENWYCPLDGAESYVLVRPGLTGLWQTSGRSGTSYPERVALDKRYVEDISLRADAHIIYRTFWTVLRREGAW